MIIRLNTRTSISFAKIRLAPGDNEVDDAAWEHAIARSMYLRTLVDLEKIELSPAPPDEYFLGGLTAKKAQKEIHAIADTTTIRYWVSQEEKRKKGSRKSVLDALIRKLETLEN